MYNYSSKDYENYGQKMPMRDMPMMDMPMSNMQMMDMPMMHMAMMNMMMMMNMPKCDEYDDDDDESDKDLKSMYPKIHTRIYPMVKYHCDMMESMHGTMYCPSKQELDHICKEICDRYEKHDREDDEDCNDDNLRQIGRGLFGDLVKILFIRDLLGRRRRRRRFNHGYQD
ncbi:hypothetical protein [Clostridium sp.]|uniref:hypothetical protein n=1 Tax=Clostridium sp. TaxID=1506 RepID=UPI001A618254|nr:hypothetical protein [Clostridium sp.]MBK5241401.1 hypothetical protein [Clostridium sp.]